MGVKLLQFLKCVTNTADSGMISGSIIMNSVASGAYSRTGDVSHSTGGRIRFGRDSPMPRSYVHLGTMKSYRQLGNERDIFGQPRSRKRAQRQRRKVETLCAELKGHIRLSLSKRRRKSKNFRGWHLPTLRQVRALLAQQLGESP